MKIERIIAPRNVGRIGEEAGAAAVESRAALAEGSAYAQAFRDIGDIADNEVRRNDEVERVKALTKATLDYGNLETELLSQTTIDGQDADLVWSSEYRKRAAEIRQGILGGYKGSETGRRALELTLNEQIARQSVSIDRSAVKRRKERQGADLAASAQALESAGKFAESAGVVGTMQREGYIDKDDAQAALERLTDKNVLHTAIDEFSQATTEDERVNLVEKYRTGDLRPELKDAVVSELQDMQADIEWEEKRREDDETKARLDAQIELSNELDQNGGRLAAIKTDPRYALLTPSQKAALKVQARSIANGDILNDDGAWLEYLDIDQRDLADMSTETFLNDWLPRFGPHKEQAIALREAAQKAKLGGSRVTPKVTSTLTMAQLRKNAIETVYPALAKKAPRRLTAQDRRTLAEFDSRLSALVEQESIAKGRELTIPEAKQVIDRATIEATLITDDRGFWRRERQGPRIAYTPEDIQGFREDGWASVSVDFEDIPADGQARMLNRARSIGVVRPDVTDTRFMHERIERAYAAEALGATNFEVDQILKGKIGE